MHCKARNNLWNKTNFPFLFSGLYYSPKLALHTIYHILSNSSYHSGSHEIITEFSAKRKVHKIVPGSIWTESTFSIIIILLPLSNSILLTNTLNQTRRYFQHTCLSDNQHSLRRKNLSTGPQSFRLHQRFSSS